MTQADSIQPEEPERSPLRVSLTSAILVGLIGSALTAAVTWGASQEKIENLQELARAHQQQIQQLRDLVAASDRRLVQLEAQTSAQNIEMIRRLDRIERKIDGRDR